MFLSRAIPRILSHVATVGLSAWAAITAFQIVAALLTGSAGPISVALLGTIAWDSILLAVIFGFVYVFCVDFLRDEPKLQWSLTTGTLFGLACFAWSFGSTWFLQSILSRPDPLTLLTLGMLLPIPIGIVAGLGGHFGFRHRPCQ